MKLIPLSLGLFAQVDDSDYGWLNQWKWTAYENHGNYYAHRTVYSKVRQQKIKLHRLIMNTPKGMQVDHRDHNGLNCQRHNMRNCTQSQNQMNKTAWGRSQYLGVHFSCYKQDGKLYEYIKASITINHKQIKLKGHFKTEEDAARAYDEAAKIHHGEFANLNFK